MRKNRRGLSHSLNNNLSLPTADKSRRYNTLEHGEANQIPPISLERRRRKF